MCRCHAITEPIPRGRHPARRHAMATIFIGPTFQQNSCVFQCHRLDNDGRCLWSEFTSYLKYYSIAIYYDLAMLCMYLMNVAAIGDDLKVSWHHAVCVFISSYSKLYLHSVNKADQ